MAFAALIAAYQDSDDGDGELRALLPMAGRTLLEHQVRRAMAAGANHAVILVERVPPALNAALDRLRRDKIAVEIAREAADAADRIHAEEQVMLIADGLVAAPELFAVMAENRAPAVLTVADSAENSDFERIDAERRWAGLALANRELLADTAAMLGDWDPQSTLMRRIVQSGARYVSADAAQAPGRENAALVIAERADQARAAQRALVDSETGPAPSWPERFIHMPLAGKIVPMLLSRSVDVRWPRLASLVLAAGAGLAFWFGWLWPGLVALLLSGPASTIAARIDRAQLRYPERHWEPRFGRGILTGLAFAALAAHLARISGNLAHLAAAATAIFLLVLALRERELAASAPHGHRGHDIWLAGIEPAIWLLPAFAIVGRWELWLPMIALYAAISLFVLQERAREAVRMANASLNGD